MAYQRSPGPAHYKIPPSVGYKDHNKTKWISPAYSMAKHLAKIEGSPIPGPKYMLRDHTRFGPQKGPAYSLKRREPMKIGSPVPGPGTYYPEKYINRNAPKYSFGKRSPYEYIQGGPGPANYNVRKDKPDGPAYTTLARPPFTLEDKSPGPAAYNPSMKGVQKKADAVKFCGRPEAALATGFGPGAGHYKYEKSGRSMPKYSFGKRHNDWESPYFVPEDNTCIYRGRTN